MSRLRFRSEILSVACGSGGLSSAGVVVLGCFCAALSVQSLLTGDPGLIPLTDRDLSRIITALGGSIEQDAMTGLIVDAQVSLLPLAAGAATVASLLLAAATIARWKACGGSAAIRTARMPPAGRFGLAGAWVWWVVPGVSELLQLIGFLIGLNQLAALLYSLTSLVLLISVTGFIASLLLRVAGVEPCGRPRLSEHAEPSGDRPGWPLAVAVTVFAGVFLVMNIQLYRGLLVPHGDSAMYEEHLWNVLHGKGFRSYLDQGLFLGEHIQVIHLLLIPVYVIFPSHLTLEVFETAALASGAFPVFWLARRSTGSRRCALLLALTWLLYPPLQFLDVAIDLKTFRPISFGVPAMLFAFDQYERRRYRTMLVLFVMALLSKEDYALVLGPFGLWLSWDALCRRGAAVAERDLGARDTAGPGGDATVATWRAVLPGLSLAAAAVVYLLVCTRVLIPWFRGGDELHYVAYFSRFGNTPGEIVTSMLTRPNLLWSALMTAGSARYVLVLLLPLMFLPLIGLSRFLVGVPILVLLCLNELIQGDPMPWHHFHAPLVPVLFWAAAGGLGVLARLPVHCFPKFLSAILHRADVRLAAGAFSAALTTGAVVGISPLSVQFWSPGSFYYWQKLYVPGPRAELFPKVLEKIPPDARVASTDFVHPRFTHFERSYDYSNYPRRVANYEDRVPDDTDFIVIDTQHNYSEIQSPDQVRELRTEPHRWEVLDTGTRGYFIVLRRRAPDRADSSPSPDQADSR